MAFILLNRVQETATANTTVSFTLAGAAAGFEPFSAIGNGNTTYYAATDASGHWEIGVGTYNSSGNLLVRTTPYQHTNFSLGAEPAFTGTVTVFISYLANNGAVYLDPSFNVSALGSITSATWNATTIDVAYGGTGVTTSTGANSVVLRDANENITVNRLNQGLQNTTASGGVTILTAASDFNQLLTGTGSHTFRLPDATTLTDTTAFQFNNAATGTITVQNNAGTTVGTVTSGGAANAVLISNATVGGTWEFHGYLPEGVTWGTNALNLGTTVISNGTWQGGTIQSGYGGTGLTTFASANNALYSTSASALAAGTLPVAAGGTGLTSYTLNGVVYASGTGTLATGSALVFDGKNLGVGATPSAWSNDYRVVQLTGGSLVTTTTSAIVGQNIYASSLGNFKYVANGLASFQAQTNGRHSWYTAPSGLANDPLTLLKETMRLSVDGTWGVAGAGNFALTPAVNFSGSAPAGSLSLDSSGNLAFGSGTANGVAYLNGSKVLTTGSALTFNGSQLEIAGSASAGAAGNAGYYRVARDSDGAMAGYFESVAGTNNVRVRGTVGSLILSANNTDRATIDTSGNLSMAAGGAIVSSRINPRTSTTTSTATLTPDIQTADQYNLTDQAVGLTVAAPTGTPVDGNKLLFRILDNGSAQTITWNGTYTVIGTTLPTTTTASKMLYVGCIYNSTNTRWDVVAVTTQA